MPLRTCFQEALWEELGHGKTLDWSLGVWASLTHSWPTTSVGSAPSFRDLATPKPETLGIKTNKQTSKKNSSGSFLRPKPAGAARPRSWPEKWMDAPRRGFPGGSDGKESTCNAEDLGSIPGSGISPGEGHGNPFQHSFLENACGQRSLPGYSPWGRTESDTTEVTKQQQQQPQEE